MPHGNVTHGYTVGHRRTSEYRAWDAMIQRCHNRNDSAVKNYGARGISVCDRWRRGEKNKSGFACFMEDMGAKPDPSLTIDRVNVDGHYRRSNCRWATYSEQAANKRNTEFFIHNGRRMVLKAICEKEGLRYKTIW